MSAVAAAAAVLATVAGWLAVRGSRRSRSARTDAARWRTVTVLRQVDEVSDGGWPAPLAALDDIEVQARPAPGGRGTELAARPRQGSRLRRGGPSDPDALRALRSALRESKQLLEVGEVLRADAPATQSKTVLNAGLRYATRNGGGEGRL